MTPQSNAKLAQQIYNASSNNQFDDMLARSGSTTSNRGQEHQRASRS